MFVNNDKTKTNTNTQQTNKTNTTLLFGKFGFMFKFKQLFKGGGGFMSFRLPLLITFERHKTTYKYTY